MSKPVQVFRVGAGSGIVPSKGPKVGRGHRILPWAAAIAAAIVIVTYAVYDVVRVDFEPAVADEMAFSLPEKPSIIVLPFANLSVDPGQEFLANGVTEDLITDLSKVSGLFVIGRNTSFSFEGSQQMIKQVAEAAGVRYVLTGSVRRSGDTLRINAQLLDALNGKSVWAERIDGAASDVFATQDAFTFMVVEALEVQLTSSESEQVRTPDTKQLAAREAFQKGWELYARFNEEDNLEAIGHFERAIQLDPEYGRAYGALALAQLRPFIFHHWDGHISAGDTMRFDSVARSLKLALTHETSLAHVSQAILYLNYPAGRADGSLAAKDALVAAGHAIAVQPNDPEAHITMAWALLFADRPPEALKFVETAMRLDPRYPSHYVLFKAAAHFAVGELSLAAEALEAGLDRDPKALELMPVAASVLAQLGRRADARSIVNTWMPDADFETLEAAANKYFFIVRWQGDNARLNRRLQEGLRSAILPPDLTVQSLIVDVRTGQFRKPFKAARYLGWFGVDAAPAVPALIEALSGKDRLLKKEAIITLGKIGPNAKAAIPALTTLADAPLIGFHARTALDLIDRN